MYCKHCGVKQDGLSHVTIKNWRRTSLLIVLSLIMPINLFADYSGRHYNSSSADLLLILAFIAIVVIAIILFLSNGNGRKSQQVKETVSPKQNHNYVPKVDVKNSTIVILSVSRLQEKVNPTSYLSSELANFSSFPLAERNEIQKVINKGACDAAREINKHILSDSGIEHELVIMLNMEEGQKEYIKSENSRKRHFYSPPSMYSEYYDLAYDIVMSDSIRFQIKHDIEAGLIQCE